MTVRLIHHSLQHPNGHEGPILRWLLLMALPVALVPGCDETGPDQEPRSPK